ncbi:MAG: glycosyltransferase family 2 protein [Cyclobacteriaceae bacterium]
MDVKNIKLSVVVAVYNEEENISLLHQKVSEALVGYNYELVLVNDGSSDDTLGEIIKIKDDKVKLVNFRRNYGQSPALMAGIDLADGEYVVTMDGDLQNDPTDIPMMFDKAVNENYDLVTGIRAKRKDGFILRKLPSKIANRLIQKSTGTKIKDLGCAIKVIKSDIAKNLGLYGEMHRFVSILAMYQGARVAQVDVKHHARQFGESKYGLGRTFKVISDLFLMLFLKKYIQRPIHLFGKYGLILFVIGMVINFYLLGIKIIGEEIGGRPILLLGVLLVISGIQLITVGLIAELQMRTYYESQDKKPYTIRNVYVGGEKTA